MRILAYCLMPTQGHFVPHPRADGDLSEFLRRRALTHTLLYHVQTRTVGHGHLYQGLYKSLPVEHGSLFLTLVRYVESNAHCAALAKRAEDWPWSSAHVRICGNEEQKKLLGFIVTDEKIY